MKDFFVIIEKLIAYKIAHPQLRLCQILYVVAHTGGWRDSSDLFYCPDNVILNGFNGLCDGAYKEDE